VFVDPAPRSRHGSSSRSSSRSPWASSSSVQPAASPRDLPQTCLVTSYRLQMNGVYLASYLPGPRGQYRLSTDAKPSVSTLWLSTAYDLSVTDNLLSDALSALSLSYIEAQEGFDGTLYHSQAMYGRATRALSVKLMDQSEITKDATLAAAVALTTYEVSVPVNQKWQPNWKVVAKCVQGRRTRVAVACQGGLETSRASRQRKCSLDFWSAAVPRHSPHRCKPAVLREPQYKLNNITVHR